MYWVPALPTLKGASSYPFAPSGSCLTRKCFSGIRLRYSVKRWIVVVLSDNGNHYPLFPTYFFPPPSPLSFFPISCSVRLKDPSWPGLDIFVSHSRRSLFLPLRPLFFCGPLSWQHRVSRVSGGGGGPEPSLSVPDYCSRRDATWVDVGTLALCVDVCFSFLCQWG